MKQNPILQSRSHAQVKFITSILLLFAFKLSFAQNPHTVSHDFGNDMKHYSTEMATDELVPQEASVMAGTLFNFPSNGINVPHFLGVGANGFISYSQYYDFSSTYDDVRVVDIVGDGLSTNATYYITCLARSGNDDVILVLPVDYTGAYVGVGAFTISSPNSNEGLYPTHSIIHSGNGDLYICGYITDNNTDLPAEPDFNNYNNKQAFIIRVNTSTPSVIASQTLNTLYTGLPPTVTPVKDFDIAMRIIELANQDIFVTGSVNDMKQNTSTSTYFEHSATMSWVLDQSLTTLTSSNQHFTDGVNNDGGSFNEYGIGLVEDGSGNKYVIGNRFSVGSGATGFNIDPWFMHITAVDNSFTYATGVGVTPRWLFMAFDYMWGLQQLKNGQTLQGTGTDLRFNVAGLQVNEYCSAGIGFDNSNVRPFLADLEVSYNTGTGDITGHLNSWTSYQNQTGTGQPGTDPNSYYDLGGGMSNVGWNPTFAARYTNNDNIVMSAPKWSTNGSNLLNLKTLEVDAVTYDDPTNCASGSFLYDGVTGCTFSYDYGSVTGLGVLTISVVTANGTLATPNVNTVTNTPTSYSSYTSTLCNGSNVYKNGNTSIQSFQSIENVVVFPNPADKEITVKLNNKYQNDNEAKVALYNLFGQKIATLYTGSVNSLVAGHTMLVPDIPTAVYYIEINVANKLIERKKLNIQ